MVHPTQGISQYSPSCHMMDYIVHAMNKSLSDNFCFKRANPSYHPYILRLYFGVLFWIQCLRAGNDLNALSNKQHLFLNRFLDHHPPETLAVPGPLLPLFTTLCSSQPEFPHFGKVYPSVPVNPGPARRDHFMRRDLVEMHFLPNVPGIFALLEDLNRLFTQQPPVYPKLGKHVPVKEDDVSTFGYHTFGPQDDRWSLVSPGLQYYCEADQKLNEAFSERYQDFDFVPTAASDSLTSISSFLHMKRSMAWFTQVKEIAISAASYFNGSGTLADCSPHGTAVNQVVVCLINPKHLPETPRCSADKRSLYEFGFKLRSTSHNLSPLEETDAAYSQTHIRMFSKHPYLAIFGSKTAIDGPFWDIRPIGSSPIDETSFHGIPMIVNRAMKMKGPSV